VFFRGLWGIIRAAARDSLRGTRGGEWLECHWAKLAAGARMRVIALATLAALAALAALAQTLTPLLFDDELPTDVNVLRLNAD
jgi:hypothetical protein